MNNDMNNVKTHLSIFHPHESTNIRQKYTIKNMMGKIVFECREKHISIDNSKHS